ncbi:MULTISPECIES: hypothetical protein [unclassified Amycolatopsis]|jgi:hypothetical protein|uniref:hypothetical protein n=1 Tax=unclassified Amycolatopsis TaxID=2618356 RepID=UPI001C69E5C9|nr:hypothetical protein [Amycolatopsis sp. DSM 110486]QYN18683.1 hypothetical protein K1T34_39100 [Amycolatopsis sp. DSM 110486]
MNDADLVGKWSDARIYPGSMEATDLVFLANGQGWSVWSNALSSEQVLFQWSTRAQRLVISGRRYARIDHDAKCRVVVDEQPWHEEIDTGYRIGPGRNAAGGAETVLAVDERISFADRFALERHELWTEDDPAGWTLR